MLLKFKRYYKLMEGMAEEFPFSGYDWSNCKFLGEGSFGKVFQVRRVQTNQNVAVKQIDMRKIQNQNLLESLVSQMNIMKEVSSSHTVKLFQSSIGKRFSYMVLQLCDTDLRKKMEQQTKCFSEAECLEIFGEIIQGVKVLVEHSYIHRDIKPANVLIKENLYKIADYGFARKADFYGLAKIDEVCGTPIYMAPQLLCNEPYNAKCDIWSLGLMLYQLIFGCPPWPIRNIESYIHSIRTKPLSFPYNAPIGKATKDFLIRALTVNEAHRMNWPDLFNHEIVKSKNTGEILQVQQINPTIRKILAQMQLEVDRKRIDLVKIFQKYEQFHVLSNNDFFALLHEISPSITTYESKLIFEFCDRNKNGAIEFHEFKETFCGVNYHEDPVMNHNLRELAGIIGAKKINFSALFDKFDRNRSGALDHDQFKNFLKEIGPKYDHIYVRNMYKYFDRDGKGLIEKKQFVQTLSQLLHNSTNFQGLDLERAKRNLLNLKAYFIQRHMTAMKFLQLCDANHDQHINEKQFNEGMKKLSFNITEEEITWIFKCIDANHSGNINVHELMQFINI